jgi:hypothetical protein
VKRYRWLHDADCTEIPYGGELSDFEYLRGQAQNNSIFQRNDGYLHLSYVGACVPAMHEMFRAVFRAVRLGLDRHPGTFGRVRLHFVGTSYAPNGKAQRHLQTLAQETGIVHLINEHPGRIPYLESLQVMLDSYVLLLVGSNEPHYTASKVFPYILAERPLLALFHEKSTAVGILRDTTAGEVITFNSTIKPGDQVTKIYERLDKLLNSSYVIKTDLSAFQSYTTETMSRRLAEVFEFGMQRTA